MTFIKPNKEDKELLYVGEWCDKRCFKESVKFLEDELERVRALEAEDPIIPIGGVDGNFIDNARIESCIKDIETFKTLFEKIKDKTDWFLFVFTAGESFFENKVHEAFRFGFEEIKEK